MTHIVVVGGGRPVPVPPVRKTRDNADLFLFFVFFSLDLVIMLTITGNCGGCVWCALRCCCRTLYYRTNCWWWCRSQTKQWRSRRREKYVALRRTDPKSLLGTTVFTTTAASWSCIYTYYNQMHYYARGDLPATKYYLRCTAVAAAAVPGSKTRLSLFLEQERSIFFFCVTRKRWNWREKNCLLLSWSVTTLLYLHSLSCLIDTED